MAKMAKFVSALHEVEFWVAADSVVMLMPHRENGAWTRIYRRKNNADAYIVANATVQEVAIALGFEKPAGEEKF